MPKLTDTQTIILIRAAMRPGNLAMPLPEGMHGAAAKMVVDRMIALGWLQEVEANLRRDEPLWRETGDGHGTTLIATSAGLEAIGIEPVAADTVINLLKADLEPGLQTALAARGQKGQRLDRDPRCGESKNAREGVPPSAILR